MISLTNARIDINRSSPFAESIDIRKARHFIHENYTDEVSLTLTARAANISPGHLSEKFKKVTGINFVEYVSRLRVERACERLHDTRARVSEIAFEVGFQSLSQFNRAFKKFSGKSPSQYRAALPRIPQVRISRQS